MPTGHCVSTKSGVILSIDAGFCALMQRPERELIGLSYKALTVPDDIDKSTMMLERLVDREGPTRLCKRYIRPDGSVVQAELLVSRFDEANHLVSTLHWQEPHTPMMAPLRMWQAALRVKHVYRCRIDELGHDLFGDFVGAILNEVYLSEAEGRVITVDAVGSAIGLNGNTMTRWMKALVHRQLIEADPSADAVVQLTHTGLQKVERLLTATVSPAA